MPAPAPPTARTLLALFLITGLSATAGSAQAPAPDAWFSGAGTWGGGTAEGEWLVAAGDIAGFHIEAENTSVSCHRGHGTLRGADGAGETGTCGGSVDPGENRTTLWFDGGTGRSEGSFSALTIAPLAPAAPPETASPWAAAILLALAMLGIGGSAALAVLWQRERTLTMHLARRLAALRGGAPKRGRGESDKDHVARILVRSRN